MVQSKPDKAIAAVEKMHAAEQRGRTASTRTEKVNAAVAKLRAFYQLGQSLPPKTAPKDAFRQRIMETEQERLGLNADTLRKARKFADCEQGYTPQEVDELCRLIREVQPAQDRRMAIFERCHLVRILSVPRRKRAALQRECIRKGWSLATLERIIAMRFGTRREGGRRRSVPDDLPSFFVQAEKLCEVWRRWVEELSRDPDQVDEEHILLADLPLKLRKQITAISGQIWQLHQDVVEELKQLQPDREIREVLRASARTQGKQTSGRTRRER
jgi:hypothetical protein